MVGVQHNMKTVLRGHSIRKKGGEQLVQKTPEEIQFLSSGDYDILGLWSHL